MLEINLKSIPIAGPHITKKELSYVMDALMNAWYEKAGTYINKFEQAFAKYVGRKYAISLPSCTAGIHLSLISLGVKKGDEVIVPDITWIASAAPISYLGAKPVFADIDPLTWCVSAKTIEAVLTKKTKAIIIVNLYGHMPNWDEINKLSKKYNIPVIEDAAQSIGSRYKNKLSGSFGVTSCFSFHGSKTITTGEGGMLLTDDDDLNLQCLILRDHGRYPGDTMFRNKEVGFKYKMSDLQAALGLAQLERIDELIEKKRQIFSWYRELFNDIKLNPYHRDVYNSYWMTTATFEKKDNLRKEMIIPKLCAQGINVRPFFYPLSSLEPYRAIAKNASKKNIVSYSLSPYAINLPSAHSLNREDINKVVTIIQNEVESCVN